MNCRRSNITRRDFLRGAAYASVAATMGISALKAEEVKPVKKTRVILIRDKNVIDSKGRLDSKLVKKMLDQAVAELFGTKTPLEAWQKVVKPKDIVGIKTNVWEPLPTPT